VYLGGHGLEAAWLQCRRYQVWGTEKTWHATSIMGCDIICFIDRQLCVLAHLEVAAPSVHMQQSIIPPPLQQGFREFLSSSYSEPSKQADSSNLRTEVACCSKMPIHAHRHHRWPQSHLVPYMQKYVLLVAAYCLERFAIAGLM